MTALFPLPQTVRAGREIIVVGFAGGGGSCEGIRQALGRDPDEALNHSAPAVSMHAANFPHTGHWLQNIWQANPAEVSAGRPIGLSWFSPDCRHFSKAKGGAPVNRSVRDLAWVVVTYAKLPRHLRPRVLMIENVEEFQTWGPLGEDGRPDPARKGETFRKWVSELRRLGYRVEWRESRACDFGAPTIRRRLLVIARCDGEPIIWPSPTHGPGRLPYRTAADIIDWSLPCPSIFKRPRPLAEATQRRIAAGMKKFVIDAAAPFIVTCNHGGEGFRGQGLDEPFRTVTAAHDAHGLVLPHLSRFHGRSIGAAADAPLTTIETTDTNALVTAWLAKHYGGVVGQGVDRPASTVTTIDHHALVTSNLVKLRGTCRDGQPVSEPLPTITAGGTHVAEVRAFLVKYFGSCTDGQPVTEPLHTISTKQRFGLVTVGGQDYEIADIGMRMLTPRELFRAQGFPDSYIIDLEHDGRPLSKSEQVRLCGNSVSPPWAAAHVLSNVPDLAVEWGQEAVAE